MKPKGKSCEQISSQRITKPVATNPFEIQVNKQKHNVLGRKSKNDRGLPGVSRNKAVQKRKESLLREYINRNKSNTFVDKRIGELDASMNPDDKIVARLAMERKVAHKKNVYSLNDDEELTHLGKAVLEMQSHDDPRSDDEDLYEEMGKEFAEKANFGGFLTKADPNSNAAKSRKQAIEELIAQSKKLKYERQAEKDENFTLIEKLDTEWKECRNLVSTVKPANQRREDEDEHVDDYDVLVKQLRFEPLAGRAAEKVKSVEEVAKEEKKKLEKLEKERQKRAQSQKEGRSTHISADDLNDGFYQLEPVTKQSADEDVSDEEDEEEAEGEDDDEDQDEEEDSYSDLSSGEEVEEAAGEEVEEEAASEGVEDRVDELPEESEAREEEEPQKDLSHRLAQLAGMIAPPLLVDIPGTEEEFTALVEGKTVEEQDAILKKIIEGNQNKEYYKHKFEVFFVILLQYLNDVADSNVCMVDRLIPHIYRIVQLSPTTCGRYLLDVISEKEEELRKALNKGSLFSVAFPGFSSLVFLKLAGQCYSTSDFSHQVVTLAMISASQMLTHCALKRAADFVRGLFVANVFCEYVSYSKRFVPELCYFLIRLLKRDQLNVKTSFGGQNERLKLTLKSLIDDDVTMTDEFRVKIVYAALKLVCTCARTWSDLPSFNEVASNMLIACKKITVEHYPESVKRAMEETMEILNRKVERKPLKPEKKAPPMKVLLEPRFQDKFDGRKHFTGGKKKVEMKRLGQKYKRELKGAMREVRRDNHFLAQHQLNEQMEKDAERARKVKQIYRDLANQEGDYNAIKRKKNF
uniref:Putative nucleolar protein n=1 Tax=Ornithodoros turicata TaxID=34597 RepID=A0A2R5LNK2_9ACAR